MLRRTFLLSGLGFVLLAGGSAAGFTRVDLGVAPPFPWTPTAATPTPAVTHDEVSLPGGLGNTQANVEDAYGAPDGLKGTMLSYQHGALAVSYQEDRATSILVNFASRPLADLGQAREKVKGFIPPDSVLIGTLGAGPARVADMYRSTRLAEHVVAPHISEAGGQFVVIFQSDDSGAITQALIAIGTVGDQSSTVV